MVSSSISVSYTPLRRFGVIWDGVVVAVGVGYTFWCCFVETGWCRYPVASVIHSGAASSGSGMVSSSQSASVIHSGAGSSPSEMMSSSQSASVIHSGAGSSPSEIVSSSQSASVIHSSVGSFWSPIVSPSQSGFVIHSGAGSSPSEMVSSSQSGSSRHGSSSRMKSSCDLARHQKLIPVHSAVRLLQVLVRTLAINLDSDVYLCFISYWSSRPVTIPLAGCPNLLV